MKYLIFFIGLLVVSVSRPILAANEEEPGVGQAEPREPQVLSEGVMRAVNRSAAEVVAEADGSLRLDLHGSHQHVYMARVGAGGKIETYCATSERAVRSFLFEPKTSVK